MQLVTIALYLFSWLLVKREPLSSLWLPSKHYSNKTKSVQIKLQKQSFKYQNSQYYFVDFFSPLAFQFKTFNKCQLKCLGCHRIGDRGMPLLAYKNFKCI